MALVSYSSTPAPSGGMGSAAAYRGYLGEFKQTLVLRDHAVFRNELRYRECAERANSQFTLYFARSAVSQLVSNNWTRFGGLIEGCSEVPLAAVVSKQRALLTLL